MRTLITSFHYSDWIPAALKYWTNVENESDTNTINNHAEREKEREKRGEKSSEKEREYMREEKETEERREKEKGEIKIKVGGERR